MQGELDAVLNFWHFCARLEANGFRRLIGANDAAKALGAVGSGLGAGLCLPRQMGERKSRRRQRLHQGVRPGQGALLAKSDDEWLRLAPIVRAEGKELEKLRDRYREGIPTRPVAEEEADAGKLYLVLAAIGGEKLVGSAPEMAPGTFWPGLMK